jgi:hypothetical protein
MEDGEIALARPWVASSAASSGPLHRDSGTPVAAGRQPALQPQPQAPDKPQNRQRQAKHALKALIDENRSHEISRWIEAKSAVRYRCLSRSSWGGRMPYIVDFENVSTTGLESSPVAEALAGLRANEARYYKNKYDHVFTVSPASDAPETLDWVSRILADERDIVISARPLEVTSFEVGGLRMAYVFYESGLAVNVMYGIKDGEKRAVGFKLSEGMDVPEELASRFKFARQKSKLAGVIRGSFFVIKGEY